MHYEQLEKLRTCIEENLRASPVSGLSFVDLRHQQARLRSKQNHVVFGRRGAGKTSVVYSMREAHDVVHVYLNLEDYKDITFPNIVVNVLVTLLQELEKHVASTARWYRVWDRGPRKILRRLAATKANLVSLVHQPDQETQRIQEKEAHHTATTGATAHSVLEASASARHETQREVQRELPKSKIDYLRLELTNYKALIGSVSELLGNRPIFLIMDDFYFIPKESQPEFIDYFHRLTKGTSLFLKIATIKHRSKLYRRRSGLYIGVELGHDIFEVDMDYTLDDFDELKSFMRQLLTNAIAAAHADLTVDELFSGEGFSQLCLASGGVPRDFLALFVNLASRAARTGQSIGKVDVTDAAIGNVGSKLDAMKKDSGDDDALLIDCLNVIKRHIYDEKRTNAFLVAKAAMDADPVGRQVVRELIDLRLVHLVDHNTSKAPSDGARYEAYILDVGLYDNSRPRNFRQIDPAQKDDKARKDDLRASPVLQLGWFKTRSNGVQSETVRADGGKVKGESSELQLGLSFE